MMLKQTRPDERLPRPARGRAAGRPWLWVLAGLAWLATSAAAQDSLRMSLASAESARVLRDSMTTLGYYNLRIGETAWRFSSNLGLEYNDNVRSSATDPLSDFIVSPGGSTQMLWPLTDRNMLNLRVGLGYSAYIENPGLSRLYIDPGSEIAFNLYAGNFVINVHDRFSINQYGYQDPTIAGSDYSRLENAAGISALWDMNKVVLRAGYDHINYVTLTGTSQPDGVSEVVFATAGYKLSDQWLAGVESGGGLISYNSSFNSLYPDASQWNVGGFFETTISQYLTARGSVGYTVYSPESGQVPGMSGDVSGVYFQGSINHRMNKYFSHSLSAGRGINFNFFGGSVVHNYVSWSGAWNIIAKTSLNTSLEYQTGEELSFVREKFDWFGGSLGLGRQLTRKLNGSLTYRGYWRESNLPDRNYIVNSVALQLRYDF
jgi:hypothetical protein